MPEDRPPGPAGCASHPAARAADQRFPRFVSGDGITRVTLVFGQLGKKDLWDDDPGLWSAREAERALSTSGFTNAAGVFRRGSIEVRVVDPRRARLRSRAATDAVRHALAESDVVYVNGHAHSGLFDSLPRDGEGSAAPKLVFVDTCWSHSLEAKALRAAYPGATLVVTDGRVTTGSVEVVPALMEAANGGVRVGAWLERINDAAMRRAARRREDPAVGPLQSAAEVYGVADPAR